MGDAGDTGIVEIYQVECPRCALEYQLDSSYLNRKLQCDDCGLKFYFERNEDGLQLRPSVVCPSCGIEYAVEVELVGKIGICADCGEQFLLE